MHRLTSSWTAASRLTATATLLREISPSASVVVVADTREAADSFVREYLADQPATFNRRRTSLARFALHLAMGHLARSGLAPTSPLTHDAVLARAVHDRLSRGELQTLATIAGFPGFRRALGATLQEVRLNSPEVAGWTAHRAEVEDLQSLDASFAEALTDNGVADRSVIFDYAVAGVAAGAHPWLATTTLVLLDLALPTESDWRLVETLARASPAVFATLPARDPAERHFQERLGFLPEDVLDSSSAHSGVARIGRRLFDASDAPHSPSDPSVRFFSAPGEGRECIEIARFMFDEARTGVRLDQMAITLRSPRLYAANVETAMRRAGIPTYPARGAARPDPAGRAFVALLRVAEDGLSARRFAEYLSLDQVPPDRRENDAEAGWVPPDDEDIAPSATSARSPTEPNDNESSGRREPWRWESLLVEASVIGGLDRWNRRLDGIAAEVARTRAATARDDPDAPALAGFDRRLASIKDLRRFAVPLLTDLDRLRVKQQTWGSWLSELRALAVRALRWPDRVLGVLTELEPMARVGPLDIAGVRSVLDSRMTTLDRRPPERRYGCVFIGSIDQARGRSFRVVFVPGLAERQFPRPVREDPLLLDRIRRLLSPSLSTRDGRLEAERMLLRIAVGAASERLYVSYPRVDVLQARGRVPSLYALEVIRAVQGTVPPVEELERRADQTTQARLSWPSPATPTAAIDPLEYDLAHLGGLLRQSDLASVKGRGRYLLEINPWLAGSLRGRYARWSKRWTPEDGFLPPASGESPVADLLQGLRLSSRPYSVSALQKFAVCPYRFFLSAIQNLVPREEAVRIERLESRTRGRILHRVYAETLRRLFAKGWSPLSPLHLTAALAEADRVVTGITAEEEAALAPAIQRVWRDEVEVLRQDVHGWLRELSRQRDSWRAIHTELGFGVAPSTDLDPASRRDPVAIGAEKWLFRGAIDLVEELATEGTLRVTDYKTGT